MTEMVRRVVMTLWTDGGQGTARRNAWVAMAADARRARQRSETAAFLSAVAAVHPSPADSDLAALGHA
jgi:hypothetical protein